MTIIVSGVSGCGKTTFGRQLADAVTGRFLDGDDFHSAASIAKMRGGIELDERDRAPWLQALNTVARENAGTTVIACSALTRGYRDALRADAAVVFVHLVIPEELARERLAQRGGHFFSASLVRSQFELLEPLEPDEPGIALDGAAPIQELLSQARCYLDTHSGYWQAAASTDAQPVSRRRASGELT